MGFSQGACLACEHVYRQRRRFGALVALTGGLIGPPGLRWEVPDVPHRIIPDDAIPAEIERFLKSVERAKERLRQIRARVEKSAGREEAAIFEVQLSILEDPDLTRGVEELIRQNIAAEKAFDIQMIESRQRFARAASPIACKTLSHWRSGVATYFLAARSMAASTPSSITVPSASSSSTTSSAPGGIP